MSESFAALFEESLQRTEMRPGEVITAEVVRVEHNFVVVNAGLKSEAYVPLEEFKNDKGEVEVQVGDFVSVAIGSIENGYGDTILSRDTAKRLASWMSLEKALESGEFVTGTTSGKPVAAQDVDLLVRALSMGKLHHAMMGTAAVAIGTAAAIPGTLVNLAAGGELRSAVRFGHPSGTLRVGAEARQVNGEWTVTKAIMSRSARVLMEGWVRVPGDSF